MERLHFHGKVITNVMPFSYLSLFLKQDILLANILHVQLYVCLGVVLVIWAMGLLTCWWLFSTEDGLLVSSGQGSSESLLVLGLLITPSDKWSITVYLISLVQK